MFKLIIEDDEGHTTVVPLVKEEITIGRKEGNTIRLTERNVSRHHARLIRSNGSVFIEDLDSYNGVKVNGDRISARTTIREGDLVEIGDYHFAIQWVAEEELAKASSTPSKPEMPPPLVPAAPKPPAATPSDGGTAILRLPVEEKPKEQPLATGDAARVRAVPEKEAGRLVVISSDLAGTTFPLVRAEMTIGRADDCDIVIPHRSVSSKHAKVVFDGGIYRVIDLDSANGVLVNGEEYARVDVRKGDVIELGHVKFRYVAAGEDFKFVADQTAATQQQARPLLDAELSEFKVGKKSKLPLILGGVGLVAVLAVGGYLMFRPTEPDTGTSVGTDTGPATPDKAPPVQPTADPAAQDFMKGLEAMKAREWEVAAGAFQAALEKNTEYPGAKNQLELARKEKVAQASLEKVKKAVQDKEWDTAMAELEGFPAESVYAKEMEGRKGEIVAQYKLFHLNLANKLLDQGSLDEARKHAESVQTVEENNMAARKLIANIDAAIQARTKPKGPGTKPPPVDRTPKVDPGKIKESAKEANQLGTKAYTDGDYKGAVVHFTKAIKLDPGLCAAYVNMGSAYGKMGDREQQIANFKRFIERCPSDKKAPAVRQILKGAEGN